MYKNYSKALTKAVDRLAEMGPYSHLFHCHSDGEPLPSGEVIGEIIELCRSTIFPGYFGNFTMDTILLRYHMGMNAERIFQLLTQQIQAGLCFLEDEEHGCREMAHADREALAADKASAFIDQLPDLRESLAADVEATYKGDPAAHNYGEVISCYPGIRAICNYRIAHALLQLGVPLIPRIITERAHSETGIDINPAATIGRYFSIDHGTGVVIGETCIIGDNVKIYQGVTLGAKNFPLGEDGNPIKGNLRHPILEDNVIVYSNATILGRVTIGKGSIIGGNIWLTHSVQPGSLIVQ